MVGVGGRHARDRGAEGPEDPLPGGRWTFLTRPFVLLCGFYFVVFFAGYQLFPLVPLHLRSLGAGLAESGRFMTTFTVGAALGGLVTGPLGDRLGSRRVLQGAALLMVLFLAIYTLLPVRWAFYVLAPLNGVVWSGLRTASVAQAGTLLPLQRRAEGMSIFGLASPGGIALGPLLGLALWPLLGFRGTLLLLAAAFVALGLAVRGLPGEAPAGRPSAATFRWPETSALAPAAISFLLGVSYGPVPPYAAQEARLLGLLWPSALLACLAGGIVGLRALLALRGLGARPIRMMPGLLLLTAAGQILLALAPGGTPRHILGGVLYGAGFGMAHTLLFMHVLETASPGRRGAGIGVLYFAYDLGQAAGALAVGEAMDLAGGWLGAAGGFRAGWGLASLAVLASLPLGRRIAAARRGAAGPAPDARDVTLVL